MGSASTTLTQPAQEQQTKDLQVPEPHGDSRFRAYGASKIQPSCWNSGPGYSAASPQKISPCNTAWSKGSYASRILVQTSVSLASTISVGCRIYARQRSSRFRCQHSSGRRQPRKRSSTVPESRRSFTWIQQVRTVSGLIFASTESSSISTCTRGARLTSLIGSSSSLSCVAVGRPKQSVRSYD